MSNITIRITESDRKILKELGERFGESMQSVIHKAIEEYRRRRLLEDANAAYAKLKQDPKLWKSVLEERKILEGTLAEGLD